ncbi:hypothetical protein ACFQY4_05725 [Catellatospora bangladeshensis]|uniref:hypothetical protein n=1 Tax=Catellatospora bangladeshensis TaxID=310355 RepID=UPI00361571DB
MKRRLLAVAVTALALVGLGGAFGAPPERWAGEPPVAPTDPLVRSIEQAQRRLREVPGDWRTWAELGSAYVEQARITGDPGYYPRAEGALHESLRLRPASLAGADGSGNGGKGGVGNGIQRGAGGGKEAISTQAVAPEASGTAGTTPEGGFKTSVTGSVATIWPWSGWARWLTRGTTSGRPSGWPGRRSGSTRTAPTRTACSPTR